MPVAILRLAGIYGPGRSPFDRLRDGTARRIVKPGQMFNRIHVDDIAQAVAAALEREAAGTFNVADDEPAPPQDVVAHAAALLGVPPPPELAFEAADMTPMARSFYGDNKRVSNARIGALGYAFSYPDRWDAPVPFLDLARARTLEFHEPAWDDFPCLRLAYRYGLGLFAGFLFFAFGFLLRLQRRSVRCRHGILVGIDQRIISHQSVPHTGMFMMVL